MEFQANNYTVDLINKLGYESMYSMNSMCLMISMSYMMKITSLNWNDIYIAYINGYISNEDVVEFAISEVEQGRDNEVVIDLIAESFDNITKEVMICDYLKKLISGSDFSEAKDKLLYITLSFVYDKREFFEDPLVAIDIIYADFDYPTEVRCLSRTINPIESIYDNWGEYLEWSKRRFSKG